MSHDRGCPCGREKYEYDDCTRADCFKKEKPVEKKDNAYKANAYQVGGDHYSQAGLHQHWDYCHEFNLDYFVGVISKYITRWRKKGQPVQDLEKAIHYTVKLRELALEQGRTNTALPMNEAEVRKFCSSNRIDQLEDFQALYRIFTWQTVQDLDNVILILNGLLEASPPRVIQRKHEKTGKDGMEHPFGYDADAEKKG